MDLLSCLLSVTQPDRDDQALPSLTFYWCVPVSLMMSVLSDSFLSLSQNTRLTVPLISYGITCWCNKCTISTNILWPMSFQRLADLKKLWLGKNEFLLSLCFITMIWQCAHMKYKSAAHLFEPWACALNDKTWLYAIPCSFLCCWHNWKWFEIQIKVGWMNEQTSDCLILPFIYLFYYVHINNSHYIAMFVALLWLIHASLTTHQCCVRETSASRL